MTTIDEFRNEYFFLSNFYPAELTLSYSGIPGMEWSMATGEHAFQSAKVSSCAWSVEDKITWLNRVESEKTPSKAKYHGNSIEIDPEHWDSVSLDVMYYITYRKFSEYAGLKKLLLATGDATLIEGNNWGDTYWGQVNGVGENNLGKVLMQVRSELRSS